MNYVFLIATFIFWTNIFPFDHFAWVVKQRTFLWLWKSHFSLMKSLLSFEQQRKFDFQFHKIKKYSMIEKMNAHKSIKILIFFLMVFPEIANRFPNIIMNFYNMGTRQMSFFKVFAWTFVWVLNIKCYAHVQNLDKIVLSLYFQIARITDIFK